MSANAPVYNFGSQMSQEDRSGGGGLVAGAADDVDAYRTTLRSDDSQRQTGPAYAAGEYPADTPRDEFNMKDMREALDAVPKQQQQQFHQQQQSQ